MEFFEAILKISQLLIRSSMRGLLRPDYAIKAIFL